MSNANGKVVIGYCSPGTVETAFHDSLVQLLLADSAQKPNARRLATGKGGIISMLCSGRIQSARNKIVRIFLAATQAEWLLMLDTDMVFESDVLTKLLSVANAESAPIVAGLYELGNFRDHRPSISRINEGTEGDPFLPITDYPENALCQVDAAGTGCMLFHRSVFAEFSEKYPEPIPWFAETVYKGFEFGEDITFCIRAAERDIPVFCHTGVKLGHMKSHILTVGE